MKQLSFALVRLTVFWMLFFALLRAVFVVYYSEMIRLEDIGMAEVSQLFVHSWLLDLSTASYLILVSLILLAVFYTTSRPLFNQMNRFYIGFIIVLYALIASAELGLYAEWKTKLSAKALAYLTNPSEIFHTVSLSEILLLALLWALQAAAGFGLYFFIVKRKPEAPQRPTIKPLFAALIWLPIFFIGARGGLSAIPVSVSSVYFSKHNMLNLTAVNPLYNISFNLLNANRLKGENLFISMPEAEAIQTVRALHEVRKDTTISILKTHRPNVVVLLLESFSADLIESLGGEPGITPFFHSLEKEGLLFTQFYASANRSQQAMSAIYAGLPGIPITTITDHPDKYASLPSLTKDLREVGYQSAFYFGGQLNYGNILSYLMYNEIDVVVEGKDLPKTMPRGRLGVHDGVLLPYAATELSQMQQPFFATIFTLSSHAPYDYPMEQLIQWPKVEKEFVNGAYYTDQSIGSFFEEARKTSWYSNTLFVIMADHSKNSYRNHPLESFEYHKIPLLLLGPALKDSLKGTTYDRIAGNTDVTSTLLQQLGLPTKNYPWSKNLFNPHYQPFAYFELNEGLGWKRPEGYFVWNKEADRFYQKEIPDSLQASILRDGKAYLQVLYEDFMKY